MQYIIADKEKALNAGVSLVGHRHKDDKIILDEKELTTFVSGETLEIKAKAVDGKVHSLETIKRIIKQGGWV